MIATEDRRDPGPGERTEETTVAERPLQPRPQLLTAARSDKDESTLWAVFVFAVLTSFVLFVPGKTQFWYRVAVWLSVVVLFWFALARKQIILDKMTVEKLMLDGDFLLIRNLRAWKRVRLADVLSVSIYEDGFGDYAVRVEYRDSDGSRAQFLFQPAEDLRPSNGWEHPVCEDLRRAIADAIRSESRRSKEDSTRREP